MKFILLFLFSFLAPFANTTLANEDLKGTEDPTKQGNIVLRREQRMEFNRIYSKMPSLLAGLTNSDFSYIALGSKATGGAFKNLQLYDQRNSLEIKTESILTLPDESWRFYGKFAYTNGFSKGGEWNLSYKPQDLGSPYYFMQEKAGEWSFQAYEFEAVAARTLPNEKVSLGVGISYHGILDFRTVDSRNESYRLHLSVNPSVTVKLGAGHSASGGLFFGRKKFEPTIYNKYQHGGETELHQIFFNQGLGTWDSNPAQIVMTDNLYGGSLSWGLRNKTYTADLIYHLSMGTENWRLNSFSNQSTISGNYARYEYLAHSVSANFRRGLPGGAISAQIISKYVVGEGLPYKASADNYFKNFKSTIGLADLTVSYLPLDGIIKRVAIGSVLSSQEQKDLNYEHTTNYLNQTSRAWVDFIFGDVNKGGFLVSLNGGYHSNLHHSHTPKAAINNFYNTSIALPSLAYLTSDYYIAGARLGSEFNLSNQYRFEATLSGELFQPARINYGISSAKYSLDDHFYNLTLSLLFNF